MDDSLIFFRAKKDDCLQVKNCIQKYEKASGQVVNFDKSAITFSPSTLPQLKSEIASILSISVVQGHNIYLGLPTFSLRSKRIQFDYLRERIEQRINSWSSKLFSMGGREVLIKSVLQAIPSYAMSCFKLPLSICKRVEQICNNFWWNDKKGKCGVHWSKWSNMCKPKGAGGLGFRDLSAFNKALLAKQIWRMIQYPNALMTKILKGRYFKNSDIMDARLGSNPSYIWRSLFWSRDLIQKGLCWRVGNGQNIRAKTDPWIPGLYGFKSTSSYFADAPDFKVANLISPRGTWIESYVRQVFPIHEAEEIINVNLNRRGSEDIRFWLGHKSGKYTVKSGYLWESGSLSSPHYQSKLSDSSWWNLVWKLNITPKVRIFLWRASKNLIPTAGNLLRHHVPIDGMCILCKFHFASTSHCLLFCCIKQAWKNTGYWCLLKNHRQASFLECAEYLSTIEKREDFEVFVMIAWAIWSHICKKIYDKSVTSHEIDIEWVYTFLENYRTCTKRFNASAVLDGISVYDCWQPPSPNHLRLDVDAGCNSKNNLFSVGAVVRDEAGKVKGAAAKCIRNPGSIKGAEIHAIRFGLDLCLRLGLDKVSVYSDSSEAVRAINCQEEDRSPEGIVVLEVRSMLASPLFISLDHMRRSANKVAHLLAYKALSTSSDFSWVDDILPDWFHDIVNSGLAS